MRAIVGVLTLAVMTACFDSPVEVPLGNVGGGSATGGGTATGGGGATGGGSTTGGGSATGGGSTTGGGSATGGGAAADGGLVPSLAPLPMASCGTAVVQQCLGACLTWDRAGQASQPVASVPDLAGLNFVVGRTADDFLYVRTGGDGGAELWRSVDAGSPSHVTFGPAGDLTHVEALATSSYATWFVAGLRQDNVGEGVVGYVLSGTSHFSQAASVPHGLGTTSNGVALGSDYYVALSDGLYAYYPAGSSRLVDVSSTTEAITALAVDAPGANLFFVRRSSSGATLWRMSLAVFPGAPTQVASLPTSVGGVQGPRDVIVVHDGWVYSLGVRELVRVSTATPAVVEVLYAGEAFPQYGGTLKAGSLRAFDGKLYFGSVCHFDADSPGYGTIELDPLALTARWLDLDPPFPLVPYVTAYQSSEDEGPVYARPSGAYIMRQ